MTDYVKIIVSIEHAKICVRRAEEAMVPISQVKQVQAYILGLLQSVNLTLDEAKKAAQAAERSEKKVPSRRILPRK